jgi:dTDP-D-glucose 4,6-dehydratase
MLFGTYHLLEAVKAVTDRPGHDLGYAIDAKKAQIEFGWKPS